MLVEASLFVLVSALLVYIVTKKNLPDNVPKGPLCIPFLGSIDQVTKISDVKRLRDKYGDIFWLKIGGAYMVYLCNYELVKEAFKSPHVTDRPYFESGFLLTDGAPAGVIGTSGEQWASLRKFLLRQMRDLGMGKSYMEDAIMIEARKLAADFGKYAGKPTNIPKCVDIAVVNVVWELVASKSYDYEDKKIFDLIENQHKLEENLGALALLDLFPILKNMPKFLRNRICKQHLLDEFTEKSKDFTKDLIDEHRAVLDHDDPHDVIDHYLIEIEEQKKNPNGPQFKSEMDLTATIFDLFDAGFDTTSNTLRWLILYVAAHPEVQRKLHEEIDAVVDYDEEISLDHKDSLPYLEATIQETHRYCSLVFNGVPHQASKDIQLGGCTIPKGTMVMSNTLMCHMDPNYWKEPEKFLPERFIDENGKFKPQKESFIPFGIGRRGCIGEALARMELYFFSALLLQKFHFAPPEGCTIDLDPPSGLPIVVHPKEQKLIINPRNPKPEE